MNALEKIAEKDEKGETLTPIEMAIYCGMMLEAAEDLAAMQARIDALEEVARVAGFIELNRRNYLFNGRQEADKASIYYMDLLKEKLNALKGDE